MTKAEQTRRGLLALQGAAAHARIIVAAPEEIGPTYSILRGYRFPDARRDGHGNLETLAIGLVEADRSETLSDYHSARGRGSEPGFPLQFHQCWNNDVRGLAVRLARS